MRSSQPLFIPASIKSIYMIAICGAGMTALAGMLKNRGYRVTGSDQNVYPPMSIVLEDLGIKVHAGFDESHLDPVPDLVIIGNAMSRGNPEVEAVLERQIPYLSLPFALREFFIRGNYSCVVSGTHGKTTTSSLLAWVLESAGRQPGFFIGGLPENFGQGYKVAKGGIFISEGDEYDSAFFDKGSKFLHYLPNLAIFNNVEFDHADIFSSFEEIKTSFKRFINLIPRSGYLVAGWDDPVVRELSGNAYCRVVSFGLGDDAEWTVRNIVNDFEKVEFQVFQGEAFFGQFVSPLHGDHMLRNALAVIATGHLLQLTPDQIRQGLSTFKNVRRRLQRVGEVGNILIFDDFAHHPTAIFQTIAGLKSRFPHRRIWAAFEPRTATSKRNVFENELVGALQVADKAVLAPLYRPEKVPESERLNIAAVKNAVSAGGTETWILAPGDEMLGFLTQNLVPDDIILFMSNGDFQQMPAQLLSELTNREKQ